MITHNAEKLIQFIWAAKKYEKIAPFLQPNQPLVSSLRVREERTKRINN